MKNFSLTTFFILIFLTSCGTITRYDKYLPVDSNPRGMKVYDSKNEFLGKTPFLLKVSNDRKQEFFFEKENKLLYHCKTNWSESVVPNLLVTPLFPVGTGIGLAGLTLDYFNGNMYSCQTPVIYETQTSIIPPFTNNSRIIVFPFHQSERSIYHKRTDLWRELNSKIITNKSISFLDYNQTDQKLSFLNITHEKNWTIREIDTLQLWKLAHDLEADYFLFFEKKSEDNQSEKNITLIPHLYDVYSLREIPSSITGFKNLEIVKKKDEEKNEISYFAKTINFLPNSVQLGITGIATKDDVAVRKHPKALPSYLTTLSLTSIDRPKNFRQWEINFHIAPSVSAHAFQSDMIRSYDFESYLTSFEAGATGHTPFGAISYYFGFGLSLSKYHDAVTDTTKFHPMTYQKIQYHAFISQRFFWGFSYTFYRFSGKSFSQGSQSLSEFEEKLFFFGYYFPESKPLLSSLFNKEK